MKVVITGPRSGLTDELELPWMHITMDLEQLPKEGQVFILNSGGSYYVKDIMWWVDAPENEAYWSRTQDYEVEGQYQIVHINVEPDNRRERYGYPAGVEDGKMQGSDEAVAELRRLVDLVKSSGVHDGVNVIDAWVSKHEQDAAYRLAAQQAADRHAGELFEAARKSAQERKT
jgi:hypothetical protein